MTPFRARAIEFGAGGLLGGLGAGFLGAKTYQTDSPRFWLSGDQVYGRDLTQDERRGLTKRVAKAALLGAGGGAGLSMGASALRRSLSRNADMDRAKKLYNSYFGQLNREVNLQRASVRRTVGTPAHAEELAVLKRLEEYKAGPLGSAEMFVDRARRRRNYLPWGGTYSRVHQQGDSMMKIPSESLAEGQMISEIGPKNIRFFRDKKGQLKPKIRDSDYWTRRAIGEIRGQ